MSAIAGMIDWSGGPAGPSVRKALSALHLHGRDGEGLWDGGDIALGWRQTILHQEDFADSQPLTGGGGRYKLVFDGRIDNRDDLAQTLALSREQARDWPDSAYVLAAFERWRGDCAGHLLGDFAFAVWDGENHELVLARDHSGKKPLVYFSNDRFFFFASMPSALFTHPDVPREFDEESLMREIRGELPSRGRTFYRGVARVPSAEIVSVRQGKAEHRSYWRLADTPDLRLQTDDEYVEAFRERFSAAVKCTLRTIHPVGSHLSGGKDSSSVTAVAARLLASRQRGLRAFTHVPPEAWKPSIRTSGLIYDEGPIAASVTEKYPNIDHVLVQSPGVWNFDGLDRINRFFEQPRPDICNVGWHDVLHLTAREKGVRVMLTGMMGNAFISYNGRDTLATMLRNGRWAALWRELVAARRGGMSVRTLSTLLLRPFLPDLLRNRLQRLRGHPNAESMVLGLINPQLVAERRMDWRSRRGEFGSSNLHRATRRDLMIRRSLTFDFSYLFAGSLAAWDIELRDPTADRRIMEFCFAIPDDQYMRRGNVKWLLQRAMTGILPDRVLNEQARGRQAADWPETAALFRRELRKEVDLVAQNRTMARLADVPRMISMLADWDVTRIQGRHSYYLNYLGLLHMIALARFVRLFAPCQNKSI